jgi:hypothetical protein
VTTLLVSLVLPLWVRTQELVPAPPPHTGIFCPMTCSSLFWIPQPAVHSAPRVVLLLLALCPLPCFLSSTLLCILQYALSALCPLPDFVSYPALSVLILHCSLSVLFSTLPSDLSFFTVFWSYSPCPAICSSSVAAFCPEVHVFCSLFYIGLCHCFLFSAVFLATARQIYGSIHLQS